MANFGDGPLAHLEGELQRDDPRFVRAMASGHPCRPQEYRYGSVSWVLSGAFAVLVTGIATEQAPVVTVGVVLAAAGSSLYERKRRNRDRDARSPG